MPNPTDLIERSLVVERATPHALKPFGSILGRAGEAASRPSDFYSGHIRMSQPVNFQCEHPVELQLASLARREGQVRYLERHFQHTQTFIPLGGKPFVIVLAPASSDPLPNLDAARAFYLDGHQGLTLHRGVWHEFPFAVVDHTDLVVALSSQTHNDLKAKDPQTQEAFGPDLDKKDIVARAGVMLTVDLDASPLI